MDNLKSGAVGELQTACELMRHDWHVSRPETPAPFDLVATNRNGHSVLVQVKSSEMPVRESDNRSPRYRFHTSRNNGVTYKKNDFHFWILFAMTHSVWFVIPSKEKLKTTTSWTPSGVNDPLEKWRNRFELLQKV